MLPSLRISQSSGKGISQAFKLPVLKSSRMGKLAVGVFPCRASDRTETAWNAIRLTQASKMAAEYMPPGLRISAVSGTDSELSRLSNGMFPLRLNRRTVLLHG